MECPECESEDREGAKFCNECGHDPRKSAKLPRIDYKQPQNYPSKSLADEIVLTTRRNVKSERKHVMALPAAVINYKLTTEKLDSS
jgi:hypothetical protein